jgi:hypothetical protein
MVRTNDFVEQDTLSWRICSLDPSVYSLPSASVDAYELLGIRG